MTNLTPLYEKYNKSNTTSNINITNNSTKINNSNNSKNKNQKRKGVLTELKRKVDPVTGIISKLSVVEDPETGETTRIISSYDPITGNKTETKTVTTTTTTMTTTTQSTTTRKTTTIDREDDEDEKEEELEEEEEEVIDENNFEKKTKGDTESVSAKDYSLIIYNDEEQEPENIFTRLNIQKRNEYSDMERQTPQKNNKRYEEENKKRNGYFSVPQLYHKKFRLDEPFSLKIPPYQVDSEMLNDHQNTGRLTLSNIDLNSPRLNDKNLLSNYSISKNKLDLSTLKKQYQLEQEINNNLLNTEKPKSKFAECEEAIGNLLSKWSKEKEERKEEEEAENKEESEDENISSFSANIKVIQEEVQKKIENNRKLHEEINNKSLKFNFSNKASSSVNNGIKKPVAMRNFKYLFIY